jgi:hypothetical protein
MNTPIIAINVAFIPLMQLMILKNEIDNGSLYNRTMDIEANKDK